MPNAIRPTQKKGMSVRMDSIFACRQWTETARISEDERTALSSLSANMKAAGDALDIADIRLLAHWRSQSKSLRREKGG